MWGAVYTGSGVQCGIKAGGGGTRPELLVFDYIEITGVMASFLLDFLIFAVGKQ